MTDLIAVIPDVAPMALVRPLANPAELMRFHDDVTRIIQDALVRDLDYGAIPGAGDKPTLLKPGAEKLNMAFGAVPVFEIIQQEIDHERHVTWQKRKKKWNNRTRDDKTFSWDTETGESIGLYRYVLRCRLMRGDRLLAEGVGSCSTMEAKYVDRPRDCENTALKMAKKRAYVDATLTAYGLSNRFTQDIEDMREASVEAKLKQAEKEMATGPDVPKPQAPQPRPTKPKVPFNAHDGEHQRALEGLLGSGKITPSIPSEHWPEIARRLTGKRLEDLPHVLDEWRSDNG